MVLFCIAPLWVRIYLGEYTDQMTKKTKSKSKKSSGALSYLLKALKAKPPENEEMLHTLVDLGSEMERPDVVLHGSRELLRAGHLRIEEYAIYINTLIDEGKYVSALDVIGAYRQVVKTSLQHGDKRKQLDDIVAVENYCRQQDVRTDPNVLLPTGRKK